MGLRLCDTVFGNMGLLMPAQVGGVLVCFATVFELAFEWPVVRVNALMILQMDLSSERFATALKLALVWEISSMCSLVVL